MEERKMIAFSWSIFFAVTAVCFLIFSAALSFLEAPRSGLFMRVGFGCAGLGLLCFLNKWLGAKIWAEKSPVPSQQEQQELF